MSHEKKLVLFFAIVFLWMMFVPTLSKWLGWAPRRRIPPVVAAAKDTEKKKLDVADLAPAAKGDAKPPLAAAKPVEKGEAAAAAAAKNPEKQAEIELVNPRELLLGSTRDRGPGAFRLEVQLEQKGAGIDSIRSAFYDAEFEFGKARKRPLEFVSRDPKTPPSMSMSLSGGVAAAEKAAQDKAAQDEADDGDDPDKAALRRAASEAVDMLDSELWEVVREDGKIARPSRA